MELFLCPECSTLASVEKNGDTIAVKPCKCVQESKMALTKTELSFLVSLVEDMRIKAITGQIDALNELPVVQQTSSLLALNNLKITLMRMRDEQNATNAS